VPPRKPYLLRLPPELLDELRAWAAQEMRSLNGQIEFLLRDALRRHGRREPEVPSEGAGSEAGDDGEDDGEKGGPMQDRTTGR